MDQTMMTTDQIVAEWNKLGNAGLSLEPRAQALEAEMRVRCGLLAAAQDVIRN